MVAGLRRYWGLASAGVVAWAVIALSWAVTRAADFASVAGLGLALGVLQAQRRAVRATLVSCTGGTGRLCSSRQAQHGRDPHGPAGPGLVGADGTWRQRLRLAGPAAGALVGVFAISWAAAGQSLREPPQLRSRLGVAGSRLQRGHKRHASTGRP